MWFGSVLEYFVQSPLPTLFLILRLAASLNQLNNYIIM